MGFPGKLPGRSPDRTWGGLGCGASCAICGRRVNADELQFELEFATGDNGDRPDYYNVHLGCYSAWASELRKHELQHGAVTASELADAVGETTFDADEQPAPRNQGPA